MPQIPDITATVTYIEQFKDGSKIGSATGFFYLRDRYRGFLVTNKHVVKNEEEGILPDTLKLLLHVNHRNIRLNDTVDIPLFDKSGNPLWKEHPEHSEVDLALIQLNIDELEKRFVFPFFTAKDFFPRNFALNPGSDVLIIGYPQGFYDKEHNLPVFRNGMIASVYGIPFNGSPCFLTDANLHPGTSGSPVVTKPKNNYTNSEGRTILIGGEQYFLLGVHSGTYSIKFAEDVEESLGLGIAWYIDLVDEISALFKPAYFNTP